MATANEKPGSIPVLEEEARLKEKLKELQRTKSARLLAEALNDGWLPQGTRLVAKGAEEGRVIVFTPEEAAALVDPLRKIIAARSQESI